MPDRWCASAEMVWDRFAVAASVGQRPALCKQITGLVCFDRDRDLVGRQRETKGILTRGEARRVPDRKHDLFVKRIAEKDGGQAAWWPQIRFPAGQYPIAFAI